MALDLGDRLRTAMSPADLAVLRLVAESAQRLSMPLYAVGGLPRDLILGRPPQDIDLVVEGDAILLAGELASEHGGSVMAHRRFGTAVWSRPSPRRDPQGAATAMYSGLSLDLAMARTETYPHAGQLPRVRAGSILDDLHRRDFTINAIAVRIDGAQFGDVLDPVGGIEDLHRKRIRVLHDGSFADDPTRMYRAVRYEQRLGFQIDARTRDLLLAGGRRVRLVSGERLRHELDMVLMEARADAALGRLSDLGLLGKVHPKLPADSKCRRRLRTWHARGRAPEDPKGSPTEMLNLWTIWLVDLGPSTLRSIGRRLALGQKEMVSILAAAHLFQAVETWVNWRPSRLSENLDRLPPAAVETVRSCLPSGRAVRLLDQYLESWRHMRPRTTGRDLLARGLPPGPGYRSILRTLRAAWINGDVHELDGERRLLERLIRRRGYVVERDSPGRMAVSNKGS